VWCGEETKVEHFLKIIDNLLMDTKAADGLEKRLEELKRATAELNTGKYGIQTAYHKMGAHDVGEADRDPTKLCYTPLCHSVFFGDETWTFHNGAQVIRVLVDAYIKGLEEIHIKEILQALPENFNNAPLSQIFKKTRKSAAWKKLVVDGPSGKGFYRLNPIYLENGVKEIRLGLPTSKP